MSTNEALEQFAEKKRRQRRQAEIKRIQEERAAAACCSKEIESGSDDDEDGSDDYEDEIDDNDDSLPARGKVGRRKISLGSKEDKLVCGIKPLPFFFLILFMFVPTFTLLDKIFKFSQPTTGYSHIRKQKQEEWYIKIRAYYADVNPEKIGEVPRLLAKYKGREKVLWRALRKKYEKDYDPHKTRSEF